MVICPEGVGKSEQTEGNDRKEDGYNKTEFFVLKSGRADPEGVFKRQSGFNQLEGAAGI